MATVVQSKEEEWASKEKVPEGPRRIAGQVDWNNSSLEDKTPSVIHIVDYLVEEAIKRRASDIHVESQKDAVLIRTRIDGLLKNLLFLPKSLQAPLISRIKVMANLDIAERRLPQDGRMKASFGKRRMDLRISIIPALYGEKAVLRLLDVDATSIPLESMGCNHDAYEKLLSLIEKPQGVIFITGPTGSGKTSTLYACLNHIKSENINVITLEDPIEYEMGGVTQIAIHEKIGLTFTETLRSVLRQDPDVIMVGEMRDTETARIAMQASLTGHLVFSTLHTNDSVSAVTRLLDMGIPPYLIASSLSGVLAQRLVRTICPRCKETYQPSLEERIQLGIGPQDDFGPLYQGRGCSYCDLTGFYGRTGIFELLILDDDIRALNNSGAPDYLIRDKAQAKGMQSLRKAGLLKIKEGKTTTKEVLRVTTR
jgi:type II secretory ATPase GspE/PulE/Tfp pilus assembly ATPase PilB-like protein